MNLEKKQQAKNLYFQTGMTNSQIATVLSVSRRTISYWVKEGSWERLRKSATHMPSLLAENCYHIFGNLTESYLSERRITNPVTHKEIDGLHKLASTINKLKNRATLNESMEMFGFFLDGLKQRNPRLAEELAPYIEEYISSRADIYAHHVAPPQLTGIGGRIPWLPTDNTEQQIDAREEYFSDPDVIAAYERAGMELPTEEEISSLPPKEEVYPQCPIPPRNEYRRAVLKELNLSRKEDKEVAIQEEEDTQSATLDNTSEEEVIEEALQRQPFEEMGLGCQVLTQSFFIENEHTVSEDIDWYYNRDKITTEEDKEYIAQFLGSSAQESGNNYSTFLS